MKKIMMIVLACSALFVTGCAAPYFNAPMTVSTSSVSLKNAEHIKQVRVENCDHVFIFFPIVTDWKDTYDKLLSEAKQAGGNAIVDFQVRSTSSFSWMFPPFINVCREATGVAAKIQ